MRLRPSPRTGFVVGLALGLIVTAALAPWRSHLAASIPALALVVPVTLAGLLGGRGAAVAVALVAAALYNAAFLAPVGSLRVHLPEDAGALVLFLVVAVSSGTLMGHEATRRRAEAQRADELAAVIAERDRLEAETRRLLVLEEVDRQRAALLRAVSHQLRTPLGSIRAITSDLQAGTSFDPATRAELLDVVSGETERLDRIVANLLSLSRIEAGALKPDRRPEELEEIIDACAGRLDRAFRSCTLRVELDADLPEVDVDFLQLEQVLTNLLENAARHSPPGGTVTVTAAQDGEWLQVDVTDEGPGVDPADVDELFAPFRGGGGGVGIGVGLAICREIVEAHGGTIRLVDTDAGARFAFTIPVAR